MAKYYKIIYTIFFIFSISKTSFSQMKVGDSATYIQLPDTAGKMLDMAKYKDKLILVDFWASWCAPCKIYFPLLKDWHQKYNDKGLVTIAVSLDKNYYPWINAIKEHNLPFIHVNDVYGFQGKNTLAYKVHYIPQKFLVYNGKIVADGSFDSEQFENTIKSILNFQLKNEDK